MIPRVHLFYYLCHHLDTLNDVMEKASPLPADGNGGSSVIATLLGTVTAVIVAKLF